jgi:quinoprotein glucose dehydrogenase
MRISLRKAAGAVAVFGVIVAASLVFGHHVPKAQAAGPGANAPYTTWKEYGGAADDSQYSALTQINKANAGELQQAWFYQTGNNGYRYGSNPIVIDGVMYVVGKNNSVAAVDAATGKEIWVHDVGRARSVMHRGLMYWESKDRSDRRVIFMADNMLRAVDARTGKDITTFGENGAVDMRTGLGRPVESVRSIGNSTPGRIFDDLLIMGSTTGEEYDSPPGDIRAYNVVTGKLVWQFHTVPHPGEFGYDTWPKDAWKYEGGTNNWGEMSLDEKHGIVYIPLGSPTYDFYGAERHGKNLFADCILALDARTGKYLWHFQDVHHDLWDYDLEVGPKLLTIKHDGKDVDILAEPGKDGFLYVLDRLTGKPIWPIEERPVPKSDVPGEESWPTQPFPTHVPPFVRQSFTAKDIDPYITDPKEREEIKKTIETARNEGIFTPPGLGTTIQMPGNNGGANWGSGAVDPVTKTVYVVAKDAPALLHLAERQARGGGRGFGGPPETQGMLIYAQNCTLCHQATLKGQPPAIPSLVGVVDRRGADMVRALIHDGRAPMPAFPNLSTTDLDNLMAYLKAPEKSTISADMLSRFMNAGPPAAPAPRLGPEGTRYFTGYGYMNSGDGLPAISPPWSTLTAYDMTSGTIKWQVPLGTIDVLAAKGITNTGGFWPRGGPVVTASGLVIASVVSDSKVHVYDKDTGKELATLDTPGADPQGIPAVYEVAGREYIAVSAERHMPVVTQGGAQVGDTTRATARRMFQDDPNTAQGYYVFALPVRTTAKK